MRLLATLWVLLVCRMLGHSRSIYFEHRRFWVGARLVRHEIDSCCPRCQEVVKVGVITP